MGMTVAVAGASGYAGGELLRLLHAHPDLTLGPLAAGSSAGLDITAVHPQLAGLAGRIFVATEPAVLAEADAVLLALPHGQSAAIAAALPSTVTVVDLGADHRLTDPAAWQHYYGSPHAGSWPYGLPELPGPRTGLPERAGDGLIGSPRNGLLEPAGNGLLESARSRLIGASRIAVPGCHATAVELALAPLLAAGLVAPQDLVVTSLTGTSGAGRTSNTAFTSAQIMGEASPYKVGRHQHSAEIIQQLSAVAGTPVSMSFTPVLVPMPRGILASCSARTDATEQRLRAALAAAYDPEPFVHLLPEGSWPHTGATLGSNSCQLQLTIDDSAGRVIVTAALDNLVKGAAGQAIQCLNLALGLPETAGLTSNGIAP